MKIAKEISIIALIILAILLVVAIFLHDYMPISKVVPTVEPYVLSSELENEVNKDPDFLETQVITKYEINGKDLKGYENSKEYDKGKDNPFSMYTDSNLGSGGSKEENSTTNNTANNTVNSNTTISNNILQPK